MIAPAIPIDETQRLAALYAAEVLDTPAEEDFDGVTRLIASICETPIARVSLVDRDRQWFKACFGDEETTETSREISFCGHAILEADLMIVEDALLDPRFADNPLVLGPDEVRFYAGAPLISGEGHTLGSLCVVDHVPRTLSDRQQEALRTLGRQVSAQLDLRRREASLRDSERRYRTLTNSAPVGIFETDADGACLFVNTALSSLLDCAPDEVLGDAWMGTVHPEDQPGVYSEWMRCVAEEKDFSREYRLQRPNGDSTWVHGRAVALRDRRGELTGFLGTCEDIDERKRLEHRRAEQLSEAKQLARTDELTGLPNRRWWDAELRRALATAARTEGDLCVAMVDIDHFKRFNDEHGHEGGDRMLRAAAAAWQEALRSEDLLARLGGEEFAVLIPRCDERAALEVIERLRAATPLRQTVSAGIARWRQWEPAPSLLSRADEALYRAKGAGRDRTETAKASAESAQAGLNDSSG